MFHVETKPTDEILEALSDAPGVFIVACRGCSEGCECSSPAEVSQMSRTLTEAGKTLTGTIHIDFLCNKALVGMRLKRHVEELADSDALLVMSCGVGVQAVGNMVDLPAHPALNTLSLADQQGLWPSSERCAQCGDCMLSLTGGICPVTTCAKSLRNGICGGMKDKMCEVDPKVRPCGWYSIYERLKELGRLADAARPVKLRDYKSMEIAPGLRTTIRWALEVEESKSAADAEGDGS